MSFSAIFLSYFTQNRLFERHERLLLACSGGVDSVVLGHLLHLHGFSFGLAHANFGLRGAESDQDEVFCQELAEKWGVPFFRQRFETQSLAESRKETIQVVARNLRYAWFAELLEQEQYAYVLTAHHATDLFETALYNLLKGTGIAGLRGFLPKNEKIVRPLFFAKREEILDFAQAERLEWREDSSNEKDEYSRNYLRHQVVPLLKKINPDLEHTFLQTAERLRSTEFFLRKEIENFEKKAVSEKENSLWLNIADFEQTEEPLIKLYEILKKYHFSYQKIKNIWQKRKTKTGKMFFSRTHSLVKDRSAWVVVVRQMGRLVYRIEECAEQEIEILEQGKILKIRYLAQIDRSAMPRTPQRIWLDAEKLVFPLSLRLWEAGDRFCPLGMQGRQKKIGDFLTDLKVPANLKKQTLVLENQDHVLWVVGYRPDERLKVSETTQNVWEIEIV